MAQTVVYCRISTHLQTHDSQTEDLVRRFPNSRLVSEIASGAKARPMLRALLDQLKPGDTLAVAALDRIGRKTTDVLAIMEELERKKIGFFSARENIDFSTPIGRMVTSVLASVAELERSMISERSKLGLEAARAKGKQIGRPRRISDMTLARGINLVLNDGVSITQAARTIGVSYPYLSTAVRTRRMEAMTVDTTLEEAP